MNMLGRKNGMMTTCLSMVSESFLRSSKWCHDVLVITRIAKLMGRLTLKIICNVENGRLMYDHPGKKHYGVYDVILIFYFLAVQEDLNRGMVENPILIKDFGKGKV